MADEAIKNIGQASEAASERRTREIAAAGRTFTATELNWGGFRKVLIPLKDVVIDAARKCVKRVITTREAEGGVISEESVDIDIPAAIIALAEALPDLPDAAESLVCQCVGISAEEMQKWKAGEVIRATKICIELNWDSLQEFLDFLTDGSDAGPKPSPEEKPEAPPSEAAEPPQQ